jgi:hypothetical protein
MSLLIYSLNSRTSFEVREETLVPEALAAARTILANGGGDVPECREFSVKLYRQGRNAIFTLDWMSVTPVMISALVTDPAEEELIWVRLLKLVPVESGLHSLNPEPPASIPWLARVLLPKHVYSTQHLEWLQDVCAALGYVMLDPLSTPLPAHQ